MFYIWATDAPIPVQFFTFMQFSSKIMSNNKVAPPEGWDPSPGGKS